MALTTDRMDEIVVALTLGKPVEPKNKEEGDFIRQVAKEIQEAKEKGYEIRIPPS